MIAVPVTVANSLAKGGSGAHLSSSTTGLPKVQSTTSYSNPIVLSQPAAQTDQQGVLPRRTVLHVPIVSQNSKAPVGSTTPLIVKVTGQQTVTSSPTLVSSQNVGQPRGLKRFATILPAPVLAPVPPVCVPLTLPVPAPVLAPVPPPAPQLTKVRLALPGNRVPIIVERMIKTPPVSNQGVNSQLSTDGQAAVVTQASVQSALTSTQPSLTALEQFTADDEDMSLLCL